MSDKPAEKLRDVSEDDIARLQAVQHPELAKAISETSAGSRPQFLVEDEDLEQEYPHFSEIVLPPAELGCWDMYESVLANDHEGFARHFAEVMTIKAINAIQNIRICLATEMFNEAVAGGAEDDL
jgi:hypothetical protein